MKRGIRVEEDGSVRRYNDFYEGYIEGTSLQGYVEVPYEALLDTFGKPNLKGDDYKMDAEWAIHTPKGLATLYNYKTGRNYLGPTKGLPVSQITVWHIGGNTHDVVEYVKKALALYLL